MSTENEKMIIGLKTQVKRQGALKKSALKENQEIEKILIDTIYKYKDYEALERLTEVSPPMFHGNSAQYGITSFISDYEYKTGARKGEKVKAHYTIYGKFLETISDKKKNAEPITYTGWFSYTAVRKYYEMYMPEVQPTKLEGFFRFKNQCKIEK